ncbi:hypothetical protein B0H10DRAFT_2209843 [Mycena sp. CBHHK59/15]|nr:hypothetical protein B0H10DRAFT_2209843 [Mycena sp. CBHHK59/15]
MSQRERREASTAHPGDIIKAKQKRRTHEEIDRDNLAKQQAKDEKQRRITEKREAGVQWVAAMEEQLRAEDERARAVAARPDIATTALKRSLMAQSQQEELEAPGRPPSTPDPTTTVDMDTDMDDPDDNAGSDGEEEPDSGEGENEEEGGEEADNGEDDDIQAKIAAFEKSLRAKKKGQGSQKNANKPQKPSTVSSSVGEVPAGEFDEDEAASSVQAAHAVKTQGKATAKMGITLTKKVTVVDVNGKHKAEPKRPYTNSDLPFPPDSFSIDLAHYQKTFIPDLINWAGSLERPFAASTRPEFKPTVQHIWDKYFSAYPFTDAVEYMAASAIGNWQSDIGKRTLDMIIKHINSLDTLTACCKWVADQISDLNFLYGEPAMKSGSYRSKLFLQAFGSGHLRVVLKTDESYGHPVGAACLIAAGIERALVICKDGFPSPEALPRKGKKSALSFVPVPWAECVASYLPPIKTLTLQKWTEIFRLGWDFVTSKGEAEDLFDPVDSTDGDNSTDGDGYVDPRACIVVSDDELEDGEDEFVGSHGSTSVAISGS